MRPQDIQIGTTCTLTDQSGEQRAIVLSEARRVVDPVTGIPGDAWVCTVKVVSSGRMKPARVDDLSPAE